MAGLAERVNELLRRHSRIAADTMVFIYFLEDVAPYADLLQPIFQEWEGRRAGRGITSTLTLLELSVQPLRLNRPDIARDYRTALEQMENLELVSLDADVSVVAAGLRARHGVSTPDAIQLAAALQAGATAFLTNDKRLARVDELCVVLLDDLLAP